MSTSDLIRGRLEAARRDLLDLTVRNRLLNTPRHRSRSRSVEIVDERAEEVFRILVLDGKAMSFLAGRDEEEGDDELWLPQPEDGGAERHTDLRLQTRLASDSLQKRLLSIYYDARTFEEEQGVSILFLAMGFLKWFESPTSDKERHAPLLLIPVELERQSASSRFRLRFLDEDVTTNLSLQAKLKVEFGIQLPDVLEPDDLSPEHYFETVEQAVSNQPRWEVLRNDMQLGFFSFAKFLMYRDLDPETWTDESDLHKHPLITGLLCDGFGEEPSICGEEDRIDELISPRDTFHVMDVDSSQALAIEEVRRSRNLVIQGPPGTGKSQTIANLIATAVKEGKQVLFVAEKMAALEVVKSRLDAVGLGDLCLELHSHKSNKKAVLEQLRRTLDLGRPRSTDFERQAEALRAARERLNRHAEIMHRPLEMSGVTPYKVIGELVRLRASGAKPAEFTLPNPTGWTKQQYEQKLHLLEDVLLHQREIGNPGQSPWRGVCLETPLLPSDVHNISGKLPATEAFRRTIEATEQLAAALNVQAGTKAVNARTTRLLVRLAEALVAAPTMDRRAIADEVWEKDRDAIHRLVKAGRALADSQSELSGIVADVAWTTDLAETRRSLAGHGRSWFRWFNSGYRQAQATLRGILNDAPPKALEERLRIVDSLIRAQKSRAVIDTTEVGRRAFGELWRGADSDWSALTAIVEWESRCREAKLPGKFRQIMANLKDPDRPRELSQEISSNLDSALRDAGSLVQVVQLDLQTAFGEEQIESIAIDELASRLQSWQDDLEGVSKWIAYYIRWRQLQNEGLGELAEQLRSGSLDAADAVGSFQLAYYEDMMRAVFRRHPEIATFNGQSHEQCVAEFRRLDLERIQLARCEVALAHYDLIPRGGNGIGELAIVRREIEKKRNHKPIRQLLKEAGRAVQAIKPVFMMSPISVAQFLEPGALQFDLLLIDEASQVRPVDALGAIARASQIVVVGDDKQLPPTQFFNKVLDDAGSDDDEGMNAGDLESVLGLCAAQGVPARMLRWHYRSRHHSLIAVSNREFYENSLFVVPSPEAAAEGRGLRFHHISDGVFDRGGSATNRIEARAVAQAVIEHARRFPEQSLGVGTFSVAQRDAILDELELLRREHADVESFFAAGSLEHFFVKNLENIQGDERDVIFISVGYARDSSGFLSMSFGPLSIDGGERRLNVLITRARERCEVFSSITADDIDLRRAKSRGAAALKTFLQYAASGMLDAGSPTNREHDSDFEQQVAKALEAFGYQVDAQVGVAGFFVDLAVIDPDRPGRYVLGIECDGAMYHSSRCARDRDRLRQQILESRGWTIHRIWSTDWFNRPEEQLSKVLAAIENAKMARPAPEPEPDEQPIERGNGAESNGEPNGSVPYKEAAFPISESAAIHELPVSKLAKLAAQIVEVEGPVHGDEVARRLTTLWGQTRVGSRIASAVAEALEYAERKGAIRKDGAFYLLNGATEIPVRSRESVTSTTLRKPEMLPSAEIRSAILNVVREHIGAPKNDVIVVSARLFGFKSTSAQLKAFIEQELDELVQEKQLTERNARLYPD